MIKIKMAPPVHPQNDKIDTPLLIYILYLASVVLGVPAIMGVIWAYLERKQASEGIQSHYVYLIHTFWKGLLFLAIGGVLVLLWVGYLVILAAWVWWIARCIIGIRLLWKREPIPDPKSWFFNLNIG